MGTNPIGPGPTLLTSFKPNYLPKAPSPKTITLGVGDSIYEFGKDTNIQSIIQDKTFTFPLGNHCLIFTGTVILASEATTHSFLNK